MAYKNGFLDSLTHFVTCQWWEPCLKSLGYWFCCWYVYYHYLGMLLVRIPLTISRHQSLSAPVADKFPRRHPLLLKDSQYKFLFVGQHWCVHRRTSVIDFSLLHRQWPAYFARLTWMVCVKRGKELCSCCFQSYFEIIFIFFAQSYMDSSIPIKYKYISNKSFYPLMQP